MVDGRAQVIPEDVQAVLPSVAGHRLNSLDGEGDDHLENLVESVAIP